ncbi:glycosyltransferase [Cetobacterium sp. SF1]|uniref:glycosyltransferase n=1 Tax=Cetobacterium sp. SF1 TaxID=3417654 RepID=UPI003CED8653
MIKVSIIFPFYNVKEYIEESLLSLLNQSLEEIEIIIINDGSRDESFEKIKGYLKNKKIIYVEQENGGLSKARNVGLTLAKGEYVAFVDSDDLVSGEMFQKLYDKSKGKDIVFCDYEEFSEVGRRGEIFKNKKYFIDNLSEGEYIYIPELTVVWNKIYRRKFLLENNILFKEGIVNEDNDFTIKCFFKSKGIKYVNFIGYFYRKRVGSITSTLNKEKRIVALREIIGSLIKFLKKDILKEESFKILRLKIYITIFYMELLELEGKNIDIRRRLKLLSKSIEKEKLGSLGRRIIKGDLWWLFKNKKLLRYMGFYMAFNFGRIWTPNIGIKKLRNRK